MNATDAAAPAKAPHASAKRPFWKRRWVRVVTAAVALVLLLVSLAPTLATSGFVLRRAERIATEQLGQPVALGDVRIGWFTPLSVDEVSIGAPADSAAMHAPFTLRGVRMPFRLWSLAALPPYDFGALEVDSVELHWQRDAAKRTNIDGILAALAKRPAAAPAPPQPPAAPRTGPLPKIPLSAFELRVHRIVAMAHDAAGPKPLEAGIDGGTFALGFSAPGEPLTQEVALPLRVNDIRHTFVQQLLVDGWWDAERTPQFDKLDLRATVQRDGLAAPIAAVVASLDSGAVDVSLSADESVGWLLPVAREALPTLALPKVDGTVRTRIRVQGRPDGALNVSLENALQEFRAEGAPLPFPIRALPEIRTGVEAELRIDAKEVTSVHAWASLPGVQGELRAATLGFDGLRPGSIATVDGAIDLDALTTAVARALGSPRSGAMATGTAMMQLGVRPIDGDPQRLRLSMQADWQGGELRTLVPVLPADPAPLAHSPVALGATDATVALAASVDLPAKRASLEGLSLTMPAGVEARLGATVDFANTQDPQAETSASLLLNFGKVLAAAQPLLPPGLPQVNGDFTVGLAARTQPGNKVQLLLGGAVDALTVRLPNEAQPLENERIDFAMEADANWKTRAATLHRLQLEWEPISALAAAAWDPQSGAALSAETSLTLPLLLERAARVAPIPVSLTGGLHATLDVRYGIDGTVHAMPAMELVDAAVTLPNGWELPLPLRAEASTSVTLLPGGAVDLSLEEATLAFGDALETSAAAEVSLADGRLDAVLRNVTRVSHAGLLGATPAGVWELVPGGVDLDGETSVTVAARASFAIGGGPPRTIEPVEVNLESRTEIGAMNWGFGTLDGSVRDLGQETSVAVRVDPFALETLRVAVESRPWVGGVEGPIGIRVSAFDAGVRALLQGTDRIELSIAPPRAPIDIAHPLATIHFPGTSGGIAVTANLSDATARIHFDDIDTESLAAIDGTVDAGWKPIAVRTDLRGALTLDNIGTIVEPAPDSSLLIPDMGGRIEFGAHIATAPNPQSALERFEFPAHGTITASLRDVGARLSGSLFTNGLRADARIDLTTRTLAWSASGGLDLLRIGDALPSGFHTTQFGSTGLLADFDRFEVQRAHFASQTLGTQLDARFALTGFRRFFGDVLTAVQAGQPPSLPATIQDWLNVATVESSGTLSQDFAPIRLFTADIESTGTMRTEFSLRSAPRRQLEARQRTAIAPTDFAYREMLLVQGLRGESEIRKTFRIGAQGRTGGDALERTIRIDSIVATVAPMRAALRGVRIASRGLDGGLRFDTTIADFLGGTARFDGSLSLERGQPVLEGTFQTTGLDLRTLSPAYAAAPREAMEIHAVSRVRWQLAPDGVSPLDGLSIATDAPRISREALVEFLRILDPDGAKPPIQAAALALQFGAASAASFKLQNGLVSMGIVVQPRFGLPIAMTVLDRVPATDAIGLYDPRTMAELTALARGALTALLDQDVTSIDRFVESLKERRTP